MRVARWARPSRPSRCASSPSRSTTARQRRSSSGGPAGAMSDRTADLASAWSGRVLVTGAAGFIGSHLSERLVAAGCDVVGVDCLTDYYDPAVKLSNVQRLCSEADNFELRHLDLASDDLGGLLDGVSHVIHLAGQPGVRLSFGDGFATYVRQNVLATQRLLEEAAQGDVVSFAYASSSSVYGDAPSYPTHEGTTPAPVSPYGM